MASQSGSELLSLTGKQPRVSVSADGSRAAVVYGEGKSIFISTANDAGTTFSQPKKIAEVEGLMLGMRRGPQIALTSNTIAVTSIGAAGNLLAWSGADGGGTWSGPVVINDRPRSAREGLSSIASGPGGARDMNLTV